MKNGLNGLIAGIDNIVFGEFEGNVIYQKDRVVGLYGLIEKPKYVVELPGKAEECQLKVKEYLTRPDNLVKNYKNPEEKRPYNPFMSIIRCDQQQMRLSICEAHKTKTLSIDNILEKIDNSMQNSDCDRDQGYFFDLCDLQRIVLKYKEIYGGNDLMREVKSGGSSYRLTYMDMESCQRKQVNLGNYLLIDGSENTVVVPEASGYIRRLRSDRHTNPVFSFQMYLYYPVDSSHIFDCDIC